VGATTEYACREIDCMSMNRRMTAM
jgi:hypothetical protein